MSGGTLPPQPSAPDAVLSPGATGEGRALAAPADRQLVIDDAAYCRTWISRHSKSFYLSSLLLPTDARRASWALYAFCRRADDTVDELGEDFGAGGPDCEPTGHVDAVAGLRAGLERVYGAGAGPSVLPLTSSERHVDAIDRAYARVAARSAIPRGLPEALLCGMEMDARGERFATWDDLLRYSFRVASTVGLMMTRAMSPDRPLRADAALRAAELGVAMQLTNIARDIGEDARRGRVYLPDELLVACGTDRQAVLAATSATPAIREATRLLLLRADDFYRSAERGIPLLPWRCRAAIGSARHIYAAIGDEVARAGYDSITRRAHTSLGRKLVLALRALRFTMLSPGAGGAGPADELLLGLIGTAGLVAPTLGGKGP